MSTATPSRPTVRHPGRNLLSGLLFGVGTAAFVDEAVFHQILHWHKFYDRSTTEVGLVSDGLFHALSYFALVSSLFLLADLRRRDGLHSRGDLASPAMSWTRWVGGVLLGAGAFQLYDGTIQHKVFGLHQIRYGVDLTAYDWTWNVLAVALVVVGAVLVVRTRARA